MTVTKGGTMEPVSKLEETMVWNVSRGTRWFAAFVLIYLGFV